MKSCFLMLLCGILLYSMMSCQNTGRSNRENNVEQRRDSIVPILSPRESMSTIHLQKGFSIKLVASEPLISTPVAMTFDDNDRIWVLEMSDYRPIKGDTSIPYPLGKVVILEDKDGDGQMDTRKVFLDSLVMPRALCLVDSGLLVATPPNLWYVKINHDKAGERTLVDSAYTVSNNPEGQTNGLLRGIDNWIYDAGFGSDKRYKHINGQWIIEKTFLRGQWGISQDNLGRLFYNNNSQNLLGDYFLPGISEINTYQKKISGFNEKIVPDNNVYPLIPTPGVNRGYRKGVLDDSGRLVHFTAACGPLIYRGGLFPEDFEGNAFVCEPAAYLIKRNILQQNGTKITGKQAWKGAEFLASSDERFRPVSLYDGPDGALYIVDMYRGVIQDDLSLTDYLKSYSIEHGLNKPINCGRIYKIVPTGEKTSLIKIPDDPDQLVQLLTNKNGWVRDKSQQKLVDNHLIQAIPDLRNLLYGDQSVITKIHALWTLEGLGDLKENDIIKLLKMKNEALQIEALTVLFNRLDQNNYKYYLQAINHLISENDSLTAPYIAHVVNKIFKYTPRDADVYWSRLIQQYPDNRYVADAIISGTQGKEGYFFNKYDSSYSIHNQLEKVLKNKRALKKSKDLSLLKKKYPKGYAIFNGTCQTCHGADGNGMEFVAPPLNGSEWVNGDKNKLIPIVLYGLSGPVKVNGKLYKKPEVLGEMPGFGNNKFSDAAIAGVLSFIRKAWNNNAGEIYEKDIKKVRKKYRGRERSFTAKELGKPTNK